MRRVKIKEKAFLLWKMPEEGKKQACGGKQDLAVMYTRGRDSDNKEKGKESKRKNRGEYRCGGDFSPYSLSMDRSKVQAIVDWPVP